MNQWHLITKRPAAFQSLDIPCSSDLTQVDQRAGLLIDKQLLQQHDPLINRLPLKTCFFIEPAQLDDTYNLISEIVVPASMLDGLFAGRTDETARRVRVFHKSHSRHQAPAGVDLQPGSGFMPNE